jgi:hypothetical protein
MADAPYGHQVPAGVAELAAEPVNVNVDGPGGARRAAAPEGVEQLVTGGDPQVNGRGTQ